MPRLYVPFVDDEQCHPLAAWGLLDSKSGCAIAILPKIVA